MKLIDFCKSRYRRLFQALRMSRRCSARYLRLGFFAESLVNIGLPSPCGSKVASNQNQPSSTIVIRYGDTCTNIRPSCTQSDSFQTLSYFRTVYALIRRSCISMILEAVATALSVLCVIRDQIIFWSWCLVVNMCLGDLFMSVTFPVIVNFRFNLRMVEGAYWTYCSHLKSILRIIQ